ncbi:serine/threonine protein kinase, partial [Fischerella thermalis WC442]
MDGSLIDQFIETVHQELIPRLQIESIDPHDPVKISYLPHPWQRLG